MDVNTSARVGRRAAFKTLPLALLFAGLLVVLMTGVEGMLIMGAYGLLGLPGLLPLIWYLGGRGGIRVLRHGGDASMHGFLMSAGSLFGAALSGSLLYAVFHMLRFRQLDWLDVWNQFTGPLYFLSMFGLPVCAVLGLIIAWFMRRDAGVELVPFRPGRTLLIALPAFVGGPLLAQLLWQLTMLVR